ncbi:restriction endonuclease subunit S [Photobacterium leiognathi]|uniref:restriction endonuclease subunit S n=1 Tax=Photobacterium leiognathi TaxID=553611 RepID=UPI003AF3E2FA
MTEQMNVPKLRFGEFDGEYIDTTLEDLTKKKISYGIVQAGPHIPNGMPYIKSTNLNKELCLDDLERTSDEIAKSYQRSEVVPEDIVFSLRGNIGATRIVPETIPVANLTQGTARLSIRDNFSNVYVNYCLGTRKAYKRVNSVSKGSTFQEISLADLRKVKITHSVDIKEQQKIASFLSKVDEKIALLTEYKKGVMQQLFNGKWEEQDGQLTFIPPTLRFKADDGSAFPDWTKSTLGDIGKVKMCKRIMANQTSENGDIPFFKIGTFGREPDAFISQELYNEYRHKFSFPNVGDILMSASGTLGRTVVYDGSPAYFQDSNIVWIENDGSFTTNEFLFYVYQIVKYQSEGGTIQRLYNNIIMSAVFDNPSLKEQKKIVKFLSAIDQKIDLTNSELDKAKEWKKGLLQQMFV